MPIFVAALVGGLIQVAGSLVGRVLLALGIGYVTYQGIDTALTAIKLLVTTNLTGAPATILTVMALLKVDIAVSMLFSALTARLVLSGLTSGKLARMVVKP